MSNNFHSGHLLNAYRIYRKLELGKIDVNNLLKLDPKNWANHVLLSSMFVVASR